MKVVENISNFYPVDITTCDFSDDTIYDRSETFALDTPTDENLE